MPTWKPDRTRPDRFVRTFALLVLSVAVLVVSPDAVAQFREYTPPGATVEPGPSRQQQLEEEMADARWRAGPLRLAPWFGIRQVQYVNNLFAVSRGEADEGVSDLTASAGLGLTAYLPLGPKVIWTAQAAPEYLWWRDHNDRNQLVGRYSTGLFAGTNRLRLELLARRLEQQQRVTSEALQLGVLRQDRVALDVELRLAGGLWLFTGGSVLEIADETGVDDPRVTDFSGIDRNEEVRRAGLAYVFPNEVRLAVGVEETRADLASGARPLSNEGTSPVLEIRVPGDRLALALDLARRDLEPTSGSLFAGFDEVAGRLGLTLRPGWRFRFRVYGRREPVLSLDPSYSHFAEDRVGLAVSVPFADERLWVRLYGETGENDYTAIGAGVPRRLDDADAWGLEARLEIAGPLSFTTGFRSLKLDSNLPGLDREVSSLVASLGLRLGSEFLWD
jgi:hypothetical protein